jgi:lactoylglutathione lyase
MTGPGASPDDGSHDGHDRGDPVRFGYTIVYVPDVPAALDFYRRAFDLPAGFLHGSGQYGQLDTGATTLAFTAHTLGERVIPGGYTPLDPAAPPAGFELTFVAEQVDEAFDTAVAAGATPLSEPHDEPWGQRVCYVRDPFGTLVGIASPVAGS